MAGDEHVVDVELDADRARRRRARIAQVVACAVSAAWTWAGRSTSGTSTIAELVGARDPAADLIGGVGAAGGSSVRRRASAAAAGRDRVTPPIDAELRERTHGQAPRLVVGQVEVDVRELAPRGDVDQPVDDRRLEPLPGEVDVQSAERVARTVGDRSRASVDRSAATGRASRSACRKPLTPAATTVTVSPSIVSRYSSSPSAAVASTR